MIAVYLTQNKRQTVVTSLQKVSKHDFNLPLWQKWFQLFWLDLRVVARLLSVAVQIHYKNSRISRIHIVTGLQFLN